MGGGVLAEDVNDWDSVIARLQAELDRSRRHSARATREIYGVVVRDLEASLTRWNGQIGGLPRFKQR